MQIVWYSFYALGSSLFWGALLLPYVRGSPSFRIASTGFRDIIVRYWRTARRDPIELPELTPDEQAYLEKARLAGWTWSFRAFLVFRRGLAFGLALLYAFGGAFRIMHPGVGTEWLKLFVLCGAVGVIGYYVPVGVMLWMGARRKARMLAEISKFAHRLSICMTEQSDVREWIVRAGRPFRLLKPAIQQLAAEWGRDQREAIVSFRDAVGISEAYPLVNAFTSIVRAKPGDVSRLLVEHSRSIDASLEAELAKRIENAPVWISFYIMIPFLVCLVLFVYPWMLTVLEQLRVSFSAG